MLIRPISTQPSSVSASVPSVPTLRRVHENRSTLSSLQGKKEEARVFQWPKKLWNWFWSLFRKKEPIKKETGVPAKASSLPPPPSSDVGKIQEYQQEIEEKESKIKKLKKENGNLSHHLSYYHDSSRKMIVLQRALEQQTNKSNLMEAQLLKVRNEQAQLIESCKAQIENQQNEFQEGFVSEQEKYKSELMEQYQKAMGVKEKEFQERLASEQEKYKSELMEQYQKAMGVKEKEFQESFVSEQEKYKSELMEKYLEAIGVKEKEFQERLASEQEKYKSELMEQYLEAMEIKEKEFQESFVSEQEKNKSQLMEKSLRVMEVKKREFEELLASKDKELQQLATKAENLQTYFSNEMQKFINTRAAIKKDLKKEFKLKMLDKERIFREELSNLTKGYEKKLLKLEGLQNKPEDDKEEDPEIKTIDQKMEALEEEILALKKLYEANAESEEESSVDEDTGSEGEFSVDEDSELRERKIKINDVIETKEIPRGPEEIAARERTRLAKEARKRGEKVEDPPDDLISTLDDIELENKEAPKEVNVGKEED